MDGSFLGEWITLGGCVLSGTGLGLREWVGVWRDTQLLSLFMGSAEPLPLSLQVRLLLATLLFSFFFLCHMLSRALLLPGGLSLHPGSGEPGGRQLLSGGPSTKSVWPWSEFPMQADGGRETTEDQSPRGRALSSPVPLCPPGHCPPMIPLPGGYVT